MRIKRKQKIFNKGYTLIEIMVTVAIFSLIFGIISGLFASALKAQRRSLVSQELLAQTSYVMEYMSRQLRMASTDEDCIVSLDSYRTILGGIQFVNYQGCCISFCRTIDERLRQIVIISPASCPLEAGETYLTSDNLKVEEFNIDISGGVGTGQQARVSMFLKVKGRGLRVEEQPVIKIQNTISKRNLDI